MWDISAGWRIVIAYSYSAGKNCGMQNAKNSIEYRVSSEERKRKEMQDINMVFSF